MLKTVAFMRVPNRNVPQYQIAQPLLFDTGTWSDSRMFILCKIEESDLPQNMHYNPNIRLKISALQKKYTDKKENYIDEDGNSQSRTIYGYFSEFGNSCLDIENQPQLTVNDVEVFNE